MRWRSHSFTLLVTDFLGFEEWSLAIHKSSVAMFKKEGFAINYYNTTFEDKEPYTNIRYATPNKEAIRELQDMIDEEELKEVHSDAHGVVYEYKYPLKAWYGEAKSSEQEARAKRMKDAKVTRKRTKQIVKNAIKGAEANRDRGARRKKEAIELFDKGFTRKEIAHKMGLSLKHIYTYLAGL